MANQSIQCGSCGMAIPADPYQQGVAACPNPNCPTQQLDRRYEEIEKRRRPDSDDDDVYAKY